MASYHFLLAWMFVDVLNVNTGYMIGYLVKSLHPMQVKSDAMFLWLATSAALCCSGTKPEFLLETYM